MNKYYVNDNAQDTGEYAVHKEGCSHMPLISNTTYLGKFSSCYPAIAKAKEHYANVDGCLNSQGQYDASGQELAKSIFALH